MKIVNEVGEVAKKDPVTTYAKGEIENLLLIALRNQPGLPDGVRDYEVKDGRGRVVTVPDFCWPDERLAVFCDGFVYHRSQLIADAKKRNWLTSFGWAYFVFWAPQLMSRDVTWSARQVAQLWHYRRTIPGLWKGAKSA